MLKKLILVLVYTISASLSAEEDARQVPTDFVRDVMQPFGIPVVSSFHAMRDS